MKPGTLYICGVPWEVEYIDGPVIDELKMVHGDIDKWNGRIRISTEDTAADRVISTLIHEVLHACFKTVTNGYPDDEETSVQALEVAIFSILSDPRNKWLRKQVRK